MNHQLTEIAFILDRSGSMEKIREEAISGFNQFLSDQQRLPGQALLTLVLFNEHPLSLLESSPLELAKPLSQKTYQPHGYTALLDAIGHTVDQIGKRLASTPETERPGRVIIAILTDGLENASTHYSWEAISERISHQQEKYQWQFLFLGANQDAIATAARMKIGAANATLFEASSIEMCRVSKAISRKVVALREDATGQKNEDSTKTMETILDEERAEPTHENS